MHHKQGCLDGSPVSYYWLTWRDQANQDNPCRRQEGQVDGSWE